MIITNAKAFSGSDNARYGWFGLRRFYNEQYVTDLLCALHKIPDRHKNNVRKQAEQIRYCLTQAKEYSDAAKSVSLVTRPVLLYYSLLQMARVEVLFKQSGDSSLDRARAQHRHHGLVFSHREAKPSNAPFNTAARGLVATPATRGSTERYGVFELWHRTSREAPMVGELTTIQLTAERIHSFAVLALGQNERMGLLPESGVTLFDCLVNTPTMFQFLSTIGVESNLLRGVPTGTLYLSGNSLETRLLIQPGRSELFEEFTGNITVNPNDERFVELTAYTSGGVIVTRNDMQSGMARIGYPPCCSLKRSESLFWPRWQVLNEFGWMYICLYIVGNYARYYPDFWIYDVEHHTELGLALEEFLNACEDRMPLLLLSELTRAYLVPDG